MTTTKPPSTPPTTEPRTGLDIGTAPTERDATGSPPTLHSVNWTEIVDTDEPLSSDDLARAYRVVMRERAPTAPSAAELLGSSAAGLEVGNGGTADSSTGTGGDSSDDTNGIVEYQLRRLGRGLWRVERLSVAGWTIGLDGDWPTCVGWLRMMGATVDAQDAIEDAVERASDAMRAVSRAREMAGGGARGGVGVGVGIGIGTATDKNKK